MENGITLADVRSIAMETIKKLKDNDYDIARAKEIRGYLDTIVSTARAQIDFMNSLPKHIRENITLQEVKAIAGTLSDPEAEYERSMKEIKDSQTKPYDLTKK